MKSSVTKPATAVKQCQVKSRKDLGKVKLVRRFPLNFEHNNE
jgi:hypothetical protein